jgi:hypothetical protein
MLITRGNDAAKIANTTRRAISSEGGSGLYGFLRTDPR